MAVKKISSMQEFDQAITESGNAVFVDFSAVWCGPCRMFAPVFERVSDDQAERATCLTVDIDECRDIAMRFGISAVPTTLVFKDGQVVDSQLGASEMNTLVSKLNKLA